MIEFRQKEFVGLQDGFGGKKGLIKRVGIRRNQSSYKNFGPWTVTWGGNALDDYSNEDDYFTPQDLNKIAEIEKWISKHPYEENSNKYGQHPLWEFIDTSHEAVIWSAKINDKDRLNYLIFKNTNQIIIINCRGHNVIDMSYSKG